MNTLNERWLNIARFATRNILPCSLIIFSLFNQSCGSAEVKKTQPGLQLITLDPGHFHAALVQKSMYEDIDSTVHVYAPEGPELNVHLGLIDKYNTRTDNPTHWKEDVYKGPDFLEKMLSQEKPGGVVVISGNNQKKTAYIKKSVDAGMHVLADKPMAITTTDFEVLKDAFTAAEKNKVVLYDIMTSRYEITNILQKAFIRLPEVFGELEKGTPENPAVTIVRDHYFLKYVSGAPLIRPVWYFDTDQEGRGIVDVTTHLVDLVQWECFPESIFDYKNDIHMLSARQWPTKINAAEFRQVTNSDTFPNFLKKDVKDSILYVDANGEMNYTIKGLHAKITMIWNVQPAEGVGDAHYCSVRGTRANLVIRQGKEQQNRPTLFIERAKENDAALTQQLIETNMKKILEKYPGITLKENSKGWEVVIPAKYSLGHEQNFKEVASKYLNFVKEGKVPDWEISGMLAKYYTTTQALEKSSVNK